MALGPSQWAVKDGGGPRRPRLVEAPPQQLRDQLRDLFRPKLPL